MSQHPNLPGHEPTIGINSDDQLDQTDQYHEIGSHRAERRWGRRRLFLMAFGLMVLIGSGVAYGTQAQHSHSTAAVGSQPAASTMASALGDIPGVVATGTASGSVAPSASSVTTTPTHSAAPTATPTPTATKTATKAPTATSKPTTPSTTSAGEKIIKAYLTGYSYFDNTPAGSVEISNPILHTTAGGTGTYADPITLAVGHSLIGGKDILDWPAGTRFYVPNLHKYFIAEDTCGDGSDPQSGPCHVGYPSSASTWLDLWIGGKGGTTSGSNACMDAITDVWTVIVKPPAGLATASGSVYGPNGCAKQYGNTVIAG